MAYTSLTSLAMAIAEDAGQNSTTAPQTDFTYIGALPKARREGPPIVVWTPGDGEIVEPNQDEDELSKVGYTHKLECAVSFLGSDYDAADLLMRNWLAALMRTQGNNCVLPGKTAYRGDTLTSTNRHEIVLTCTVDLPVTFETYTTVEIDVTAQAGTVVDPG